MHLGSETKKNDIGLQFAGHNQMEALVDYFAHNFSHATHVILSGGSAGGLGALAHANWLQSKFPVSVNFRVVAQAGYFFALDVRAFPEWLIGGKKPFAPIITEYLGWWYKAYIPENCTASPPHLCLSASTMIPFIKAPIFLANNAYDAVALQLLLDGHGFDHSYLKYFGATVLESLKKQLRQNVDGAWIASCLQHTANLCFISPTRVANSTYRDVLTNWINGGTLFPYQVFDNDTACGGLPCNPHCGGPCDPQ